MQFVPRGRTLPFQIESRSQAGQSAPPSLAVPLSPTNGLFELRGNDRADRRSFFCGKHAGLPQQIFVDFQGDVCLHSSTIPRAALFYVRINAHFTSSMPRALTLSTPAP